MPETGWNGFLPERVQHREGMLRFSGAEGFVRNGPCLILLNDQSPRVSVSLSQYQDRDWSWEKERKSTKMFTKRTSLSPTQLRKLCSLRKKKKLYIYILSSGTFFLKVPRKKRISGVTWEKLTSPDSTGGVWGKEPVVDETPRQGGRGSAPETQVKTNLAPCSECQGPWLPFKCFKCQFYPSTAHIQKSMPTLHVPLNEFSMNRAVEPPPDQEREPRSHVHRPLL